MKKIRKTVPCKDCKSLVGALCQVDKRQQQMLKDTEFAMTNLLADRKRLDNEIDSLNRLNSSIIMNHKEAMDLAVKRAEDSFRDKGMREAIDCVEQIRNALSGNRKLVLDLVIDELEDVFLNDDYRNLNGNK